MKQPVLNSQVLSEAMRATLVIPLVWYSDEHYAQSIFIVYFADCFATVVGGWGWGESAACGGLQAARSDSLYGVEHLLWT